MTLMNKDRLPSGNTAVVMDANIYSHISLTPVPQPDLAKSGSHFGFRFIQKVY